MAEEAELERWTAAYAKKLGMLTYKLDSRRAAGWPDRMFLHNGYVRFIEFKAMDGSLTPLQKHTIEDMRKHGADVHVVNNKLDAQEVIDELYRFR